LREENQRKTLEARERTNKQLYSHDPHSHGIEPGTTEVRVERYYRHA
jgi:hypothetical protein